MERAGRIEDNGKENKRDAELIRENIKDPGLMEVMAK